MYEILVGLEVSNSDVYAQYREAIKPILMTYGGAFGYDFVVSKVLRSQVDEPMNRVFTINFPSQKSADSFFTDRLYLKVKAQYFTASVLSTTIIASYQKAAKMHKS